jgi:hypothetical protein
VDFLARQVIAGGPSRAAARAPSGSVSRARAALPCSDVRPPSGDSALREGIRRAGTACALFTLFAEPFFVAFDVRPIGDGTLALCTLADTVLALDLLVSFVTGYHWLAGDGVWKIEVHGPRVGSFLSFAFAARARSSHGYASSVDES